MIYKIKGRLDTLDKEKVVMEINGIFYEVLIPRSIYEELKGHMNGKEGQEIVLYTIYYLDGGIGMGNIYPYLIGFLTPMEREFFKLFTTVKGLGTRKALKSLVLPVSEIARAIEGGDGETLKKLPHIGGRTAKKIIAELKGKMATYAMAMEGESISRRGVTGEMVREGEEVLLKLGYNKSEAGSMIERALNRNKKIRDTEALISEVFKEFRGA